MHYDGILMCNKPFGISSHKVISAIRSCTGQQKIGHTGTLDPRATGLMVVCLGRATKIARFLSDVDKEYKAEIRLGIRSVTYDSEGVTKDTPQQTVPELTEKDVRRILKKFTGRIIQKVPVYSAVKVGGRRLYELSRMGKTVEPPEREVEINYIELDKLELPNIYCTVGCSKGTYIRALANDIGEAVGCGGFLAALNRSRVGQYNLDEALSLDEVKYLHRAGMLKRKLKPIESVLPFPSIRVDEKFSADIITGRSPEKDNIIELDGSFRARDIISLKDYEGRIMAVGRSEINSSELPGFKGDKFFTYIRVLN